MIVWGGWSGWSDLHDGGRYNPAADSWTAVPTNGAPTGREAHTAVWTGTAMIVWGGVNGSSDFNDGGRYNPVTSSWSALPITGAPAGRSQHTAVWTGSEMIVWGGERHNYPYNLNDGGRFNPAANSWTVVPTAGAPAARADHAAVWTGSEMIIFGGTFRDLSFFSDTWTYYLDAPAVRISRTNPSSAVVAWPVWHPILRLCQTTNLAAGPWIAVTNGVTQVGSENHVTVSPLSGNQFFRAEYP